MKAHFDDTDNLIDVQQINEIMERNEGIAMAAQVLMNISKDETGAATSEFKYQCHEGGDFACVF